MDKMSNSIEQLKRYHFWILIGIVVVVSIGCWFVADGQTTDRRETRERAIDGQFKSLISIADNPHHPSEALIEFITEKNEEMEASVQEAWRELRAEQTKKNELPEGLSEEFKTYFYEVQRKPGGKLKNKYLEEYQTFIGAHFPTLFEENNILRYPEGFEETGGEAGAGFGRDDFSSSDPSVFGRGGGMSSGGVGNTKPPAEKEVEMEGVVAWNESDKNRVLQRFEWTNRPSTEEVVLAQEDLWVYEALLRTIKVTNEGATEPYNATITEIEALEIGADAAAAVSSSLQPIITDEQDLATEAAPSAGGFGQAAGGVEERRTKTAVDAILEGRYVDDNGKPLPADQESPYKEFKMMPIRMSLVMDQTKIPKLLVACANSNMPIEIKKVRLQPNEFQPLNLAVSAGGEGAAGQSTGSEFGRGTGSVFGAPRSTRPGKTGGANIGVFGRSQKTTSSHQRLHIPVELQGIIYIYNPPPELNVPDASTGEEEEVEPGDETPDEPADETPDETADEPEDSGTEPADTQPADAAVDPEKTATPAGVEPADVPIETPLDAAD